MAAASPSIGSAASCERSRATRSRSRPRSAARCAAPKDPAHFDRAPWTGGLNFEVHFDYGYDGIMRSYEQALVRLALDTVDALVIHDLDTQYHGDKRDGVREAAHRQRHEGAGGAEEIGDIKAYGMGINTGESLDEVASKVDLDFVLVAMPYTLLDQAILETSMADLVRRGVSVIIGSPFASGILVTGSGGNSKYGYAAAPADIQAARPRASKRLRRPWRVPAGGGAAVRARPPRRGGGHPRRDEGRGGQAERGLARHAHPRRLLVGPEGAQADPPQRADARVEPRPPLRHTAPP